MGHLGPIAFSFQFLKVKVESFEVFYSCLFGSLLEVKCCNIIVVNLMIKVDLKNICACILIDYITFN